MSVQGVDHIQLPISIPIGAAAQARAFYEDPFGNRIELIEPASGFIESTGNHRASDLHFSV